MASDGYKTPTIGIDLGTTYSCVAVCRENNVEIIENDQGKRLTPSCVAFTEDERLVGIAAKNHSDMNPGNTLFAIKRLIGRRFSHSTVQNDIKHWPFKVVADPMDRPKIVVNYQGIEKEFYAEEISSMVLEKMKEVAETRLGCTVNNAVITVPAYFNDSQRQATKNAGAIAGLNVVRIMDEPTAAAVAYGMDKITEDTDEKNVLIFDLGGGTCDVSLLSIKYGKFVVRAIAGDTHLGGEDFDDRLVDYCVKEFKKINNNKDITKSVRSLRRLRTECQRAKEFLSFSVRGTIEVGYLYDGIDFSTRISRALFEDLNMDLFTRCTDLIERCLNDAMINKTGVDVVVLVGGSTRIPMVQQLVQDFFGGKELCKEINPDEAVAKGAAIQAANLNRQGDNEEKILILQDVTPLSLGVNILGGKTIIVVPRNAPIPMKKYHVLTTSYDNQTEVRIAVYEGESAESKYNNLLGEYMIIGIDPAPEGVPKIDTCFEIDADGILTVSTQVRSTSLKNKIVISKQKGGLTPEEIQTMVGAAARYKAEDEKHKAMISLEDSAQKVKSMSKDPGLSASEKKLMNETAENVITWLNANRHADISEINGQHMKLETIIQTLMKSRPRGGIPYDWILFLSKKTQY
ncbi:hypothetical protein LUZ63_001146 [Rhynchospora breviuscula]|uniref:Heat shock protein 70 n=1 Tax=Rhynchospora breviuscula TaxID=2022672 RepID=A0A9Q0HWS5_9POAL|nr:hypothetical protein LUZ63_001146 [Rhynchospora breviuscula]